MRPIILYILLLSLLLSLPACSSGGGGDGDSPPLLTNSCSTIGLGTRVINGTACSEQGSPIVEVLVRNRDGSVGLCSGTMITADDVLTAAHCFFSDVQTAIIRANAQRFQASRVILHPAIAISDENLAVFNDVAIVQLSEATNLPTLPIVMSRDAQVGDVISIFGYGLDENGETNTLRSGEMALSQVTPNHIFAPFNGVGSNTCNGDSGGPAILQFQDQNNNTQQGIVGLVSTGRNLTCSSGDTTLFANVQGSSIFDFIVSIVPDIGTV